jgi:hypothetical protein
MKRKPGLRRGAVRRLAYEASDCGCWLTAEQGQALWKAPHREPLKGKRDRALLALLLACGLPRHELAEQSWTSGEGRTIPVPDWVHGC